MNSIHSSMQTTLAHLQALVSFDTQNPPRKIDKNSNIFNYLKESLPGFSFKFFDAGNGCICLLATRGTPDILFNFHIDTVPVAAGWNKHPFQLKVSDNKAYGLGACDIKGASACILSAANKTQGDLALLFSSDEEHGTSAAIKLFLQTQHGFKRIIVAEPTQAKAIVAHRGFQNVGVKLNGVSGHGSQARALNDSAIHNAGHWISSTVNWVANQKDAFDGLQGIPFNIGKISGGVKTNMIATDCEFTVAIRALPGQDENRILKKFEDIAHTELNLSKQQFSMRKGFYGPTLPASNQDFQQAINQAKALAKDCQLEVGSAVNFWTEASLFSESGLIALVFGPGDIAQAHTADEWVSLEQLAQVEKAYIKIINSNF